MRDRIDDAALGGAGTSRMQAFVSRLGWLASWLAGEGVLPVYLGIMDGRGIGSTVLPAVFTKIIES